MSESPASSPLGACPEQPAPAKAGATRAVRQHETPDNFRDWLNLLSVMPQTWRPDSTNSVTQPDVEVLAITLKETPLTADKFSESSMGCEWVQFSLCVLAVGPTGFSNVSCTKKKPTGKVDSKNLYESDNSQTRFFPFDKGATNT